MANILVIDDEEILLDLISNTLRLDGHNVTALCSPTSVLASQSAGTLTIDLLVTDVELRPISGFELAKRLSDAGYPGRVLFMSGYPATAGRVNHGPENNLLLEKPFTAQQLRSAVATALSLNTPKSPRAA